MTQLPNQPNTDPLFAPTDITRLDFWTEEVVLAPVPSSVSLKPMQMTDKPSKLNKIIFYLKNTRHIWGTAMILFLIFTALVTTFKTNPQIISPLIGKGESLQPLGKAKNGYEVFGFAPHWTFNKLDNVDFGTLTTLAYFGVEAKPDGNLNKESIGYETFMSEKATQVFKKAHANGTRVVLTITQMNNDNIKAILDDPAKQESVIAQTVESVKNRGVDGVNIDFEYTGNPGDDYRQKFTAFSKTLTDRIHAEIPGSKVTASVYASAVKDPKIYEIGPLADATDGIFMMAYDFAVAGSNNAIPTAPLYGHKEGKYWYDISTAVDAFLTQMPSEKLILGVPWYGYNYAVNSPAIKTAVNKGYYTSYKKGRRTYKSFVPLRSFAQTATLVKNNVTADTPGYQEGFDELGKVSWKAYQEGGVWRMVFIDDVKSQAYKYDFAKDKNLAGVGMWALGFDDGPEVWQLLKDKFGAKAVADSSIIEREIH